MMHALTHRWFGVVLLPLLILSNLSGLGGWFCADGVQCRPATTPSCCCGHDEKRTSATVALECEHGAHGAELKNGRCGCYYQAPATVETQRKLELAGPDLVLALPVTVFAYVSPPGHVAPLGRPSLPSPPRYLVSPRDTRAPPPVA